MLHIQNRYLKDGTLITEDELKNTYVSLENVTKIIQSLNKRNLRK